jgi:hypothetical protein
MNKESELKSGYRVLVWVFVAGPLLYVLSVGHVAKLTARNGSSVVTVQRIYAPVIWLHNNTAFAKPLEAYMTLWGVK